MSATAPSELVCDHIGKIFQSKKRAIAALEDVSFRVLPSEFVAIVGPSGCGKSTLLKIIAGLLEPTSGQIQFPAGGTATMDHPRSAMVFQEHGLFPWMTILDNVAFGMEMHGVAKLTRETQAHAFLQQFGIDGFAHNFPHELSVGMRQRTAIARAFLTDPQILLMDEPFSALDAQSKMILQEELLRIWKDYLKTVIYITHDIDEAVLLADRVLVMSGRPGRIREEIQIPLDRPRNLHDREESRVREITWHIWQAIESDVRKSLQPQA
jgi:NitT/TauT family transport system ATP-binding protein